MQRLQLLGGSYSSRSVIANAQRCLNLFPEKNRGDSPSEVTLYQRPGLVALVIPDTPGAARCIYQASNGDGYIIVGNLVYWVSPEFELTQIGDLGDDLTTPCSMVDNGVEGIIVNGNLYAGDATGSIEFTDNPSAAETATLNGVVWTFVAGTPSGNQVQIGGSTGITIASLQVALTASTDPDLTDAVYSTAAGVGDNVFLNVQSKLPGAQGTLYTLAATAQANITAMALGGDYIPGDGWTFELGDITSSAVTPIVDAYWTGADRVDYIDTFIIWNIPGTASFGSTTTGIILPLDSTYVATKTGWPDFLQSIIVNKGQILLPGALKGEQWYNSGSAAFPFARLSGVAIEHGVVAKYSVCSADQNIYWLSRDLQGQGYVLRLRGNEATRISNYALEYAIRLMYEAGTDITDAVGYTFQLDGHLFYVLSFPSGNQTWVWDESVGDPEYGWHQRGYTDVNGAFNRDRGALGAALYGKNVVLDWENGTLYEQSMTTYTDEVDEVQRPILYLRSFPHLVSGTNPKDGLPILAHGQMVQHDRFALDTECGNNSGGAVAEFNLLWSDDRGRTWGNTVLQSAGQIGQYKTRPDWRGLGQAMDRVYQISWNFPGQVALNGAWVEGRVLNQ